MINLNLIQLDGYNNPNITDVSWMASSLQILNAGSNSGITDYGIKNLNLLYLNAFSNPNITDISWMGTSLQILDASGTSGITDKGIKNSNPKIKFNW